MREEDFIRVSKFCSFIVLLTCASILAGWILNVDILRRPFPNVAAMNPSSTITFVMAALVLLMNFHHDRPRKFLLVACASFVLLVGLCKLASVFIEDFFQVDALFFQDHITFLKRSNSYSMSLTSAIGFICLGLALLLNFVGSKSVLITSVIQSLIGLIGIGSFFFLVGYTNEINFLYDKLKLLNISLQSTFCFFLLSISFACSTPRAGVMEEFFGPHAGARLLRKMFPLVLLAPLAIGIIQQMAHAAFSYSIEMGNALLIFLLVLTLLTFLIMKARLLNQKDKEGEHQQEEIRLINFKLITSNNEISTLNEELAASNEELSSLNEELAASNEELSSSNEKLHSLNEHLEQANQKILKQSQIISRQNEEKLNKILESSLDAVWSYNFIDPTQSYISRSAEQIFGATNDTLANSPRFWLSFVNPQHKDHVAKALKHLDQSGSVEISFQSIVGEQERWLYCKLKHLTNQQGEVLAEEGVISDITSLKNTESALRDVHQSLANFKKAVDRSSIVSRADLHGNIIDVNDNFEKISGFLRSELIGKNHRIINSGYHPKSFWSEMWTTVSAGGVWRAEVKNRAKAGSLYWVDTFIMPFFNAEGKIQEFLSIRNDITSRKEMEETLRESESKLSTVFQNTNDFFVLIDRKFKVLTFNKKYALLINRLVGKSVYVGGGLTEFIPESRVKKFNEVMKRAEAGETVNYGTHVNLKGGEMWLDVTITPVQTNGNITGFCVTMHDTTHIKEAERELDRQKLLLERAQETARIGSWMTDLTVNPPRLTWSKETLNIYGLEEHEFDGQMDTFFNLVYAMDRPKIVSVVTRAIDESSSFRIDHRIQGKDGSVKWVFSRGRIIKDTESNIYQIVGVVQDISERKQVEEILLEYNKRFEILSRATNDAIWDWDIHHNTVLWNHGLQSIFGYGDEYLNSSKDWMQSKIHPDDLPVVLADVQQAFDLKANNWSGTYRFLSADGHYKFIEDRAYIIFQDDIPLRMIGAKQDITQRVKALEEIEKLSLVASNTDNAIAITDASFRIEWVNNAFSQLLGYSTDQALGQEADSFVGPDTDESVRMKIRDAVKNNSSIAEEIAFYTSASKRHWFKLHVNPILDKTGDIKNYVAIYIDIDERKEYENRLSTIARELSNLIENANVPIFAIDTEGFINEWNKVAETLTGVSRTELIGKLWIDEFVVPEEYDEISKVLKGIMISGNAVSNLELSIRTKGQKIQRLLMSASPRTSGKTITGVIMVAQNITELSNYRSNLERIVHERTRELNEALANEKNVIDLKSKFISIASHEFRTPLSTINLLAGAIKRYKEKLSARDLDEKVDAILKQVNHMTYLLDDVLTIGKADAGRIPIVPVFIEVASFLETIKQEVEQATGQSHNIITRTILRQPSFTTDEKLLRNILINLLTNAIKFSPKSFSVECNIETDTDMMIVDVFDTGIGIPEKDLKNLFQPFSRGTNVNAIQGTGLGLSIVNKAVDLLKGRLNIETKVDVGTRITITIPNIHEEENTGR